MLFKSQEDFKFLRRILVELNKQFDDQPIPFTYEINRTESEFHVVDTNLDKVLDKIQIRNTWIQLFWRPNNYADSTMKHVDKVELNWNAKYGELQLIIRGSPMTSKAAANNGQIRRSEFEHTVKYEIGMGQGFTGLNGDIMKNFIRLYKKIKVYQDVEVVRLNKEKFDNACYEMFPHMLDELFLENPNEEENG